MKIAVLGAGITGSMIAIRLANLGYPVVLFDRQPFPVTEASLHNEGKLHFGYVYGADSTKRTAVSVAEGSFGFVDILSKELAVPRDSFSLSQPFYYGIPNDSLLTSDSIGKHFRYVDTLIAGRLAASKPLSPSSYKAAGFCADQLQLVLQTEERSVDTAQIGRLISGYIGAHPNITFRSRTVIQCAKKSGNAYKISFEEIGAESGHEEFDAVFNCLWGGRLKLDRHLGLASVRPHLMRYKVAIRFSGIEVRTAIPSLTLMLGEYGDIVNHGNGNYYLSWYPECKIAETVGDDPHELHGAFASANKREIVQRSIDALSKFAPGVQEFQNHASQASVHGGIICSWGHDPIPMLGSEIHQRFDVGVNRHGNWFSIDTGKYCMGPNIALHAVEQLLS